MYQAKKLGKNQISGNPRPRPPLLARRSISEAEPPAAQPGPAVATAAAVAEPAAAPPPVQASAPRPSGQNGGATAPAADRAVAVELGPVVAADAGAARPEIDDAEADPQDVRRQIAAASRSFDPDHQIRRAMDAFLSPAPNDPDRPTPDH
jgi:hypothetical protein